MKTNQPHATWVEVDLSVLQKNIRIIREVTQIPIMAVVKANGYGHGFIPVTKAAVKAGVKNVWRRPTPDGGKNEGRGNPVQYSGAWLHSTRAN